MDDRTKTSPAMRNEQTVFAELSALCRSAGYVHAVSYLCFRDNTVRFSGEMTTEDMGQLFSKERLVRTEISTLIGLMVQGDMDFAIPVPGVIETYLEQTEALLLEMHHILADPLFSGLDPDNPTAPESMPVTTGQALREPIFYSGESAYSFQYRDFAPQKYSADDPWLLTHKGFTSLSAKDVVQAVGKFLDQQAVEIFVGLRALHPDKWTLLPMFRFSARDIAGSSGIDHATVKAVLSAFALPKGNRNGSFTGLYEFNATNAYPLLPYDEDTYLLFQYYSLAEALYETPFFWMWDDQSYRPVALEHRGQFTERFCLDRLEKVFGKGKVYPNINIYKGKDRVSEIDTLVLFGNRAVVVQAKSKRLTLLARKGHDGQIREDFQKSVQDSYGQGLACARLLLENQAKFVTSESEPLKIPAELTEVYVCCVVSDHYPALSFQARQFLKVETSEAIPQPLVLDVFALDAMTEMLDSPLHFLCYLERRARYSDKLMAVHELNLLGYHLTHNLWVEDENDFFYIHDDLSVGLDVAMTVRRDGIPGKSTPDGILTRFTSTTVGHIVKQIEFDPGVVDLGLLLLSLNGETVIEVSDGIQYIAKRARSDGKGHDLTIGITEGKTGLTVHCNTDPPHVSGPRLHSHCERRKYSQQADSWFGICIHPKDNSMRFGVSLTNKWQPSLYMEELTRKMPPGRSRKQFSGPLVSAQNVGRNDLCPCGSGRKYKKCCLMS